MYPVLVLLAILPSTSAFVDCRAACRICRDKSEQPAALEVHCAMCDECKLRRRDSLRSGDNHQNTMPTIMIQLPNSNMIKPMGSPPAFPGYGAGYPPGYPGYPGFMPPMMLPPIMYPPPPPPHMIPEFSENCPTPSICGSTTTPTDSGERIPLKATTIVTTSTSTTTSKPPATRRPCPPAPSCIKRQVMVPPMMHIVPGIMMPSCGVGVMPMAMPCAGIPPSIVIQQISATQAPTTHAPNKTYQTLTDTTEKTTNATTSQDLDNVLPDMRSGRHQHLKHVTNKETTSKDFFYVYVGLPKKGSNNTKDPTRVGTE